MGKGAFSWSFTRSELRETCPRAFCYSYYSWDELFADDVRALKLLNGLWMVAGQAVDITIARSLEAAKARGERPDDLSTKGLELFDELVRTSPNVVKLLKERKPAPMESRPLHGNYYGLEITDYALKAGRDRVVNCLYNFEVSPLLRRILSISPDKWGDLRTRFDQLPPKFAYGETLVWANYDFMLDDEDCTFLIDWKTGKENPEKEQFQMAIYALYAHLKRGFPVDKIYVQIANLQAPPDWMPTPVTDAMLDTVRARMDSEIASELALVRDSGEKPWKDMKLYWAKLEDFEPKAVKNVCEQCNFLELCEPGRDLLGIRKKEEPEPEWDPFAGE